MCKICGKAEHVNAYEYGKKWREYTGYPKGKPIEKIGKEKK